MSLGVAHHIEILLLAAGASSRLGRPKQLLPFSGTTLVRHLAQQALAADAANVRVIVGAHRELVEDQMRDLGVTVVENVHWSNGLCSSIHTGLNSLPSSADGVIIMLCDMPHVTTLHLNAMINAHKTTAKGIVASRYASTPGVPTLFTRRYFRDIFNLRGDAGAKSVLLLRAEDMVLIDLPGGNVDIDTEEDIRQHLLAPDVSGPHTSHDHPKGE
ncbi:MAG: hypothetical protein A2X67_06100 [Ignavibacteria bacterium GWA2_55_11]|nr:MAG: hypothetical protein A2X67_06100 [Ignavibacteria bacterium GWA2_55_11]OGU46133.1 MAG: hypothetical protein A2X68_09920 [Ignavibacteria bacterium GWC2_56_12]OGU76502.1 MAG: hypothetical protein A3G43_06915 [Ignavibacteria bacterium RIFCSPLOWO2_12_FULL_56_21]HAV24292.1 4-diphosphocytidyl-2C-methyl-D-erythritol synthase [Bacteroidota bacterium]